MALGALCAGALTWLQYRTDQDIPQPEGQAMGQNTDEPTAEELIFSAMFRLPPQTGTYVNCDEVQRTLRDLMSRAAESSADNCVVSAITGQGGIGKTALAVRVAHSVRDLFPDGQLYVNLRGYDSGRRNPYEVLGDFLRALGVDGTAIPAGLDQRTLLYQSRMESKRMLVVLDNARDEAQIRPLLPETPRCPVIITSRTRLISLTGTHSCDMQLFDVDSSLELLRRVVGAERIDQDEQAARRIAELCDGLPLAVWIAAAKLAGRPHWTPSMLAERLEDARHRLSELHVGDLAVRATFTLSYAGLSPEAQRLFRLLAVCPPTGFPFWVAGVLTEEDSLDAAELLETLVDVHVLEAGDSPGPTGRPRYVFHDLLRVYGQELLSDQDSAETAVTALSRLVSTYTALAERACATLGSPMAMPPDPAPVLPPAAVAEIEADPLSWFEAERATIVSLVDAAHQARLDNGAWRLACALRHYFDRRARWQDWIRTHEWALASAERAGDDAGRAMVTWGLGVVHWYNADWNQAIGRLTEAIELFRGTGNVAGEAHAHRNLGVVRRDRSQWPEAQASYLAAIRLFEEADDPAHRAVTLRNLGDVHRDASRFTEAHAHFDRAAEIYAEHPDVTARAYLDRSRGDALCAEGRFDEAMAPLRAALEVFGQVGDRRAEARTLRNLGIVHVEQAHNGEAEVYLEKSLELFSELGDLHGESRTRLCLATVYRRTGRSNDALRAALAARIVFADLEDRLWEAKCAVEAGDALLLSGDRAGAAEQWRAALATFEEIDAAEASTARERLAEHGD
ncbi:tetratricopeptide repeat protein [Streptomyces sp. NPDC002994]|uniref:ATP-binding protein n=1 Tax=Streptomyces sp. NPDC002994 TaxID=3154441 RepID=UPI0033B02D02